jgi:hypothetical protein
VIWYIFPRFGIFYQEKSGNPGLFCCFFHFTAFADGFESLNPGLPDGLFSNQKSQFGKSLEGLRLENVDIPYDHLEYFTDIWDIFRTFGIFYVHLGYFTDIWDIL